MKTNTLNINSRLLKKQVINLLNFKRLKPVLQVLSTQVLLQIVSFVTSIILIREMSKTDYATYTVLMSVQAILIILSDSGISIGFKYIGGKIWNDDVKIAVLINTAMVVRWQAIFIAFAIAGGYCFFILVRQGINPVHILLFLICLFLIASADVQKAFIQHVLLLKQEIATVQLVEITSQGTRLLLILSFLLFVSVKITALFVLIVSVLSIWASFVLLKLRSYHLRKEIKEVDAEYKNTLMHYIKKNWYNSAFFAFQGQISIFIVGLFGTSRSLADLGALTRFGLVFTVLSALVSNIIGPAFGRCQIRVQLLKMYISIICVLCAISFFTLITVYFFPKIFLWVLGNQYYNLAYELFLVFLSGLITFASGAIFTLNVSKGWIKFSPIWEIPTNVCSLIIGVLLFDIDTLSGVLKLSIVSGIAILTLYIANSFAGFNQLSNSNMKNILQ